MVPPFLTVASPSLSVAYNKCHRNRSIAVKAFSVVGQLKNQNSSCCSSNKIKIKRRRRRRISDDATSCSCYLYRQQKHHYTSPYHYPRHINSIQNQKIEEQQNRYLYTYHIQNNISTTVAATASISSQAITANRIKKKTNDSSSNSSSSNKNGKEYNADETKDTASSSPSSPSLDSSSCSSSVSSRQQKIWNDMLPATQKLAQSIVMNNTHTPSSSFMRNNDPDPDPVVVHPRVAISRAITLLESKHPIKKHQGDLLLTYLLSSSSSRSSSSSSSSSKTMGCNNNNNNNNDFDNTLRIGFAGPPGAGKSCMIESFGIQLLQNDPDLKLAIVCIDPSSTISGGSILGDKTRMRQLSSFSYSSSSKSSNTNMEGFVDRVFIRPSSNSQSVGGIATYTDDVVKLLSCAAAGYNLVFVETVGLGQSEIEIIQSVDVLVLLIPPGGGDELQGVKKGIVELANIIAITKTDSELEPIATRTASDYKSALRVLQESSISVNRYISHTNNKNTTGTAIQQQLVQPWKTPVLLTSSRTGRGLDELWNKIQCYQKYLQHVVDNTNTTTDDNDNDIINNTTTTLWKKRRQSQMEYWMWKQFTRMIQKKLQRDTKLKLKADQLEIDMKEELITPRMAAQHLVNDVFRSIS